MVLTAEQKEFFAEHGYLRYGRVLTDDELAALRQRSADIVEGRTEHVPAAYVQRERQFRGENDTEEVPVLDRTRKMTHLAYFDELFESMARKSEIVDVIEELLGPNIKLYHDQLMMKPRYHGTVTDWHQDSPAWPWLIPQMAVSAWVALDDATVENGCMTVIPGSHKWGPVPQEQKEAFLAMPELADPVPVELPAGHCMFHHGQNMHRTGANQTPHRRRGLALHYIPAETKYLGARDEDHRIKLEAEQPPGKFRFMLIRGQEFAGRA